jgi:hypothetical protein
MVRACHTRKNISSISIDSVLNDGSGSKIADPHPVTELPTTVHSCRPGFLAERQEWVDTVEKLGMYKTAAWEGGISVWRVF